MVQNDKYASVTRMQIEKFKITLKELGPTCKHESIMQRAKRDAIEAQLLDLTEELQGFEA